MSFGYMQALSSSPKETYILPWKNPENEINKE